MRNLALGSLLILTSAAAIGYVYTKPDCQSCQAEVKAAIPEEPAPVDPGCSKCKSGVVDVVDLNTAYPIAVPATETPISFEEPPLAKPRQPEILPAQFEQPVSDVEVAPSPRVLK